MLADDLLSHYILGGTYHVSCSGFVTVSTFFTINLKLLVWSEMKQKVSLVRIRPLGPY